MRQPLCMNHSPPILAGIRIGTGGRLQVTGYKLQVAGYRLRVTGCGLQVTSYRLRVTGFGNSQLATRNPQLVTSRHKQSTVYVYRLTGDIGSIVGGQKCYQTGDVLGFADSFQRNVVDPFLHELTRLVVTQKFTPGRIVVGPHIGIDDARTERVHRDVKWCEFLSETLGNAYDTELASGVMGSVNKPLPGLARSRINDSAEFLLLHPNRRRLTTQKHAFRVHRHNLIPFLLR